MRFKSNKMGFTICGTYTSNDRKYYFGARDDGRWFDCVTPGAIERP